MKEWAMFRTVVLLAGICGLVAINGCGGGGGDGGAAGLSITTASLPAGARGQLYSVALGAAGGTTPYGWGATGLPPGISIAGGTGILSGTPTAAGTFSPVFTVTDNTGLSASRTLSLVVNPPPSPSVSTTSLPAGIQNHAYSGQLAATGGTPPYTWSVTGGTLPTGVGLDNSTGALTGTPTDNGTFTPTFTVTDNNAPPLTGSRQLSIVINPSSSPFITTSVLPVGTRTEVYTASLSATGGAPPYTWSVTGGTLPAGVGLDNSTGALTGTPTVEGTFTMTFTVTDFAANQAQKSLDLRIAKPLGLAVADYSTPSGAVNIFDNASLANGAAAWTRQLKGSLTTLDNAVGGPPAGVSYDAARNILYVARTRGSDNGAILVFNNAGAANDNIAPSRTIRTYTIVPKTFSLNSPSDVFNDSANDRIYIADVDAAGTSGTIVVLNNASSATPSFRKIFSFLFGPPAAISLDVGRDILYVVPSQGPGIIAYDNVSTPSFLQRAIAIGGVTGVGLVDVKIDHATDTAYVADYDGGRVFVVNNVSQKNGTYAPDRTLTGLSNPNSVFLDVAHDRLYVSNRDGGGYLVGVVENMSTVTGTVLPFSRQLSGFGVAAGMTGF